ncbi:hypothetical protein TL16_g09622 [Triparma laevis f. inornata]|uniref:Uncharacterized protein n=1 Tax=Triparma laevis f. inornata TaxID=1714386 RepID=A0A9W7B7I1_9STRA|nr:hypothetical protein TL16_g09622 [Triparma laevis f. inornata]
MASSLIMTDANFTLGMSKRAGVPGDPYWRWIPLDFSRMVRAKIGMFIFNNGFMVQFVLAVSLFIRIAGPSYLCAFLAIELLVVFSFMAAKDELFGFAITGHSSFLNDYILGPIVATIYWILTSTCPAMVAIGPCELGPSLFTGLIGWRFISNCMLMIYSLSILQDDSALTWISYEQGLIFYVASLVVAIFGLILFVSNLEPEFSLSTLFKPVYEWVTQVLVEKFGVEGGGEATGLAQ